MVKYNSSKKELIIKGDVYFKDIVKAVDKNIVTIDENTGKILIKSNFYLEDNSTLYLDSNSYILDTEIITFKTNSGIVIGNDNNFIKTSVDFKNLKNIIIESNVNINIKHSQVSSNSDWILDSKGLLSITNSIIKDFNIYTETSTVLKDIVFKEGFIYSDNVLIFNDIVTESKFDRPCMLELSNDVYFYNSILKNYNNLVKNTSKNNIKVFLKDTNLLSGYNFDNSNIDLIQEFLYSGTVYDSNGKLYSKTEFEIINKYNDVVNTFVTDEEGKFNVYLPYYVSSLSNKFIFPLYIKNNEDKIPIVLKEKSINNIVHINSNIDKNILLLIERLNNKLDNEFTQVKTGLANVLYNSEKPIKNVSPTSVKSAAGTKLTI